MPTVEQGNFHPFPLPTIVKLPYPSQCGRSWNGMKISTLFLSLSDEIISLGFAAIAGFFPTLILDVLSVLFATFLLSSVSLFFEYANQINLIY